MIILGHEDINYENITCIKSIDDIKSTKPNSIVAFNYEINILKYCYLNNIKTMVKIDSIKEALFCNNLNAYYILTDDNMAAKIQEIAQNYMFDSKIIQKIFFDNDLVSISKNNIDGVVYDSIIKELEWVQ